MINYDDIRPENTEFLKFAESLKDIIDSACSNDVKYMICKNTLLNSYLLGVFLGSNLGRNGIKNNGDNSIMTNKDFLTSGGEISKEIEYSSDEDNVLVLYQCDNKIILTPRQIMDVKEFMDAYIDTVDWLTMKRINDEKHI